MNIAPKIWKRAEKLGLGHLPTGGGNDFVCAEFGGLDKTTLEVVLSATEDGSCLVDDLDSPADVSIWLDERQARVALSFDSAREALKFLAAIRSIDVHNFGIDSAADGHFEREAQQ